MRNFRTAAVAAATAVAVAFSGTAIASAQDGEVPNPPAAQDNSSTNENNSSDNKDGSASDDKGSAEGGSSTEGEGTLSSKIASKTGAYDDPTVKGTDLFGSSINDEENPQWAKIWREGTYALIGTAIAGALIGAYNYAVFAGILPKHVLDPLFGIK